MLTIKKTIKEKKEEDEWLVEEKNCNSMLKCT
jgi:hypothetical protein